jgi:transcription termination/antitermination protein NusA
MDSFFGNIELIQVADAVAREKNIPKEAVIEALEEAIRVAARRKYGHEHSIRAEMDRKSGEIRLFREMMVVEDDYVAVEEPEVKDDLKNKKREMNVILLQDALAKKEDAQIGEVILEPLPPIDLGRVAAQSARQVITNKIREIEREKQFNEFKDKVGQIVSGVVEKIEYGNVIIKIGSAEAVIKRDYLIKNEKIKQGERIRAYVYEVNKDAKGPQVLLSRTHNEFLAALFAQEVPEIYDHIIQIKNIARDPGSKAKVAVFTSDTSIDPIGSCVGMRGSRVQAVINELNGERIDIVEWSSDPATLVVNALSPAEVTKVIIDEDKHRIEVVVPDEQLSIAIGKRGQNVRLASEMVGWSIDVLTEETESKRRGEEFRAITEKFMASLDLEEILAQLLASEGFTSLKDVAEAEVSDFANIEGIDEGIAEELINRAKEFCISNPESIVNSSAPNQANDKVALDPKLLKLSEMTRELAVKMHNAGIKTILELADLAHDEFVEQLPDSGLKDEQINKLIMQARDCTFLKKAAQ